MIKQLEKFAPLSFAESWDNVGLLVEPSSSGEIKKVGNRQEINRKSSTSPSEF
jgi:putative NIF3 family GTP cyclohydrolase 1 type 2